MRKSVIIAFVALAVLFTSSQGYAASRGCDSKCGKTKSKGCPSEIIMKKAHFILRSADDLELTDEQMIKVKNLKMETKKEMIKRKSAIELIAVDIKSKMYDDPVDTTALNELVDKKYELKKGVAKYLVGALADLKGILTQDQKDKMKNLKKLCSQSCN